MCGSDHLGWTTEPLGQKTRLVRLVVAERDGVDRVAGEGLALVDGLLGRDALLELDVVSRDTHQLDLVRLWRLGRAERRDGHDVEDAVAPLAGTVGRPRGDEGGGDLVQDLGARSGAADVEYPQGLASRQAAVGHGLADGGHQALGRVPHVHAGGDGGGLVLGELADGVLDRDLVQVDGAVGLVELDGLHERRGAAVGHMFESRGWRGTGTTGGGAAPRHT